MFRGLGEVTVSRQKMVGPSAIIVKSRVIFPGSVTRDWMLSVTNQKTKYSSMQPWQAFYYLNKWKPENKNLVRYGCRMLVSEGGCV